MLKILAFKRNTLLFFTFNLLIIGLVLSSIVVFYHSTNVEKLLYQYPVYDFDKKNYKFVADKPENWISVDDISKYAKWSIIVSEDWAYYEHAGVDINQVRMAVGQSIIEGKLVRGASTITQQLIKNTILTSERSLKRKLYEMLLAYKLNSHSSKDKVLEQYLNIVHMGKDIYGIGSASMYYFNKRPKDLTAREGAFLAMLLPSPEKYSISFNKKEVTPFAKEIIDSILVKLRQAKVYKEEDRLRESVKKFYWEKSKNDSLLDQILDSAW